MSKQGGWRALDAASHQSMTRFHNRTQWEPTSTDMPFSRLLDATFATSLHEFIAAAGAEDAPGLAEFEQWQKLQAEASRLALAGDADRGDAQRAADAFYEENQNRINGYREHLETGDGAGGKLSEHDMKQRLLGAVALFDFLQSRGSVPMDFFRQFTAVGRALHREPYSLMTMREIAMMEGQSPASHSWRCKLMSGEIELMGMKGSTLPGQKSKAASEAYKKCRKGNNNRLGGKKAAQKAKRARQGSFLAKLNQKPAAKQKSFLRKLHVPPKK